VEAAAVRRLAAAHRAATVAEKPLTEEPAPEEPALEEPALEETAPGSGESGASQEAGEQRPARRLRWPGRTVVLALLAVATLVFGGLAAWFGTEAGAVASGPAAQNRALSDPGETSQVTSQVTAVVVTLFSYNYANPNATSGAVGKLLTGAAVKQYAAMFATIRKDGPKEKLVVTTTVSDIGVELLTHDTARVLVLATESEGSAGATAPETLGAMFSVNAVLVTGTWKIEGLDTFTS
jgi:Mce-associated membrane protein